MPQATVKPTARQRSSWRHPGAVKTLLSGAAVTCLLLSLTSPALALRSDRDQPLNITADTSEVDAKTGFTRITGGVVITQGTLVVHADEARVFVNEGRVNRVELDGEPATWEQQLESGEAMDARAAHIDYDVPAGMIELTGDARVDHPQGEISGARLQYELDTEKLRGLGQGSDRVRIRIEPDAIDQRVLTPAGNSSGNASDATEPAPADPADESDNADSDSERPGPGA
ncbi:MAG: hypothetical protein Tsb002_14390 [Wenzhouxiangellaceae bacterium]